MKIKLKTVDISEKYKFAVFKCVDWSREFILLPTGDSRSQYDLRYYNTNKPGEMEVKSFDFVHAKFVSGEWCIIGYDKDFKINDV